MKCPGIFFMLTILFLKSDVANAQEKQSAIADPEAGALLEKSAEKYMALKGIDAAFTLTTVNPKLKPEDPDSKYTSIENGHLLLLGKAFKISINNHEIWCDGKTIWSYSAQNKEVQVNDYEESQETFSPARIFSVYKDGYAYQIKEKKNFQGKSVTVIELAPVNRKVSFFKIDVAIDNDTYALLESKIYEKSGVRYIYKLNTVSSAPGITGSDFVFDSKKYPGVKEVDLR